MYREKPGEADGDSPPLFVLSAACSLLLIPTVPPCGRHHRSYLLPRRRHSPPRLDREGEKGTGVEAHERDTGVVREVSTSGGGEWADWSPSPLPLAVWSPPTRLDREGGWRIRHVGTERETERGGEAGERQSRGIGRSGQATYLHIDRPKLVVEIGTRRRAEVAD